MIFINFNGKVIEQSTAIIPADNRGLRYGDGLFETMKMVDGKIPLFDLHMQRLWQGMGLLQFNIPVHFTSDALLEQVSQLCEKNKIKDAARVRLNIVRGSGGLFDPIDHKPNYIIETSALPDNYFRLNENGLVIDIYPDAIKPCDRFSNCKTNNYLGYAMAALFAKQQKLNDCLVLNQHKRICDASIANVFCIVKEQIFTPALAEGPVAGVMRNHLLTQLKAKGYSIKETDLSPETLLMADEVFLSNATYGIRWVRSFQNKNYSNELTTKIYSEIS